MILEVFNIIQNTANSHGMIKSFQYGDSFNIQKIDNPNYPMYYLEYPFVIRYDKGTALIDITTFVYDIPNQGEYSDIIMLDKLEQIQREITTQIDLDNNQILSNINGISMISTQADNCSSFRMEFTLKIIPGTNICLTPKK